MTREANTPSARIALIALARTRRVQRALAHAYIHRHAPLPGLRSSLGYMTSTACVAEDTGSEAHRMTVIGYAPSQRVAYVVEDLGPRETPIVYRLWLHGPRQGYLVPLLAWYEQHDDAAAIHARIAALQPHLEPVTETSPEHWMLSTRIVQRRALRVAGVLDAPPIRKYALQLVIEPVSGGGPCGKTTVTAFLRPQAQLVGVWSLPGERAAIARVSFTGIPNGHGLDKDTVVLLTPGVNDSDA